MLERIARAFNELAQGVARHQDILFVGAVIAILITIFVPLPTILIDFLLVVSITLSILVLMTVIYVRHPLQFSVFPSVLLVTTAYRLALNIATTRLILAQGNQGPDAAGQVIQAFGNFMAAADPVIGIILFAILVIVNFVVITKGSNRISEVAARFTLDAMPGKQMAIDADLNAGLIKEADARKRREEIMREADFYGAMDGATKFVRGDAIAGIIIALINIIGGFVIGALRFDMPVTEAMTVYTILTIGDGLVTQIPALIVSLAAGMMVTRATAESNLGREFIGQMGADRKAIGISAAFLGLLLLTTLVGSGLPFLPLLLVSGGLGWYCWRMVRQAKKGEAEEKVRKTREAQAARGPERVDTLLAVDPMELEVGHGLLRLVDPQQGGPMLERITRIRRQMAVDLGIEVPPVRIRDNIQLEPNQYVIKIRGTTVARGTVMPDLFLAMDSGAAAGPVEGLQTREPVFGLNAYWVREEHKPRAEAQGYTVVEPSAVMATHLTEIVRRNAADLLTRDEVQKLIKNLKNHSPAVVEEVVDKVVKVGEIQKVLQNLLREGVSIRDLATIVETLGDTGARVKDPEVLTEYVRNALARAITQAHAETGGKLYVVTVDPRLEETVRAATERSETGSFVSLPPNVVSRIAARISREVEAAAARAGRTPVVLCSPQVRATLKRIVATADPSIVVLSYNEIVKETPVESLGSVGLEESPAAATA
jgi:flagellar biosynthesis protein FlhA